jgi:iron complex outermembrane receptor protein
MLLGVSVAVLAAAPVPALAEAQTYRFDLPAQSLDASLRAFARTTRQQILFDGALVRGKKAPALRGSHSAEQGLVALLRGSGLTAVRGRGGAWVLSALGNGGLTETGEPITADKSEGEGDIVVTGSRIAGGPPTAPVVAITAKDIREAGYNNLGEVFRALPQNFSGGQNPEVSSGTTAGGITNFNVTGGAGLNLRGLGPDATLTLVNGVRLPFDGLYQATDVSTIPTAMIDRVEVLLDGASAIYGSDAVGGVANILLKRNYQGAEVSARFGLATRGGGEEQQYSAAFGHAWGGGSLMAGVDYASRSQIRASDRDRLSYLPLPEQSILPGSDQISLLAVVRQDVGAADISLTGQYGRRTNDRQFLVSNSIYADHHSASESWSITPAINVDLGTWAARVQGTIGSNDLDRDEDLFNVIDDSFYSARPYGYYNQSRAAEFSINGPLFEMPGGATKVALGGGYRHNKLQARDLITQAFVVNATTRNYYAFGELLLPLVSPEQEVGAIERLTVQGAVRYENYNGFGDVVVPKAGIVWSPVRDLDLRASWGRSFKAPAMRDQFADDNLLVYSAARFGGAPGTGLVLLRSGGNPRLEPERANVLTAGFTARPGFAPGLQLEAGWFRIDYRGRVVTPITSLFTAFSNPVFAEFLTMAPSAAYQEMLIAQTDAFINSSGIAYDPAQVVALIDNRTVNAARQVMKGVDVSTRYATRLLDGDVSLTAGGSWLKGQRTLTSLSSAQAVAGVRFFPAKFRGKAGASWSRDGLTLAAHVNYIAGVTNIDSMPSVKGGSMTTVDIFSEYFIQSGPLRDLGFSVYVNNLFDEDAPYLKPSQAFYVDYDSTNYSIVGRTINFRLTKRF